MIALFKSWQQFVAFHEENGDCGRKETSLYRLLETGKYRELYSGTHKHEDAIPIPLAPSTFACNADEK